MVLFLVSNKRANCWSRDVHFFLAASCFLWEALWRPCRLQEWLWWIPSPLGWHWWCDPHSSRNPYNQQKTGRQELLFWSRAKHLVPNLLQGVGVVILEKGLRISQLGGKEKQFSFYSLSHSSRSGLYLQYLDFGLNFEKWGWLTRMYQLAIFIALDILVICMNINLIVTPLIHLWQKFPGSGVCVINDARAVSQTEQILAQQLNVPMENIPMENIPMENSPGWTWWSCTITRVKWWARDSLSEANALQHQFQDTDFTSRVSLNYSFFPPVCSCPMC